MLPELIDISNRNKFGSTITLKRLKDTEYELMCLEPYFKCGYEHLNGIDRIYFVEPFGGPYLEVGRMITPEFRIEEITKRNNYIFTLKSNKKNEGNSTDE